MRTGLARRVGRDVCRHWRGRLSLATSFWINGFALNLLLGLWAFELARWMRDSTIGRILAVGLAAQALVFVVSVWQWCGVWRASGRRKTHFFARLLARACVLASVVHVALSLVHLATSWRGSAPDGRWMVRVLGNPDEAELRGPLNDGASAALNALLQKHPHVGTLHVTSPGGLVNEGLRLANLVRARRLRVVVDSSCASACTLVLLASSERLLRPDASLGFHRMRAGDGQDIIPLDDDTAAALGAVGASQTFIDRVRGTASYDMWRPSQKRLLSEGVITGIAQRDQFTYCPPHETLKDARQAFEAEGALAAMAEIEPERYQRLLEDYLAGPTRGTTLAEAVARLSAEESAMMNEAACHPAVAVSRARAAQLARIVTAISARFPERCAVVLDARIDLTGLTREDLGDDYQQVLKTFVVQSRRAPSPQPSPEQLAEAHRLHHAKLSSATLKIIEDWKRGRRGPAAALCSAAVEYDRVMAELEPEMIARLLRYCPASP